MTHPLSITNQQAFWLVWQPETGKPNVKHDTFAEAQTEAERLARNNRGKRFYVLQAIAHAVVDEVKVEMYGDEIPF